jgi:hypothetical protein
MPTKSNPNFWRPPLWKWAIFVLLTSSGVFLIRHKPAPQPVKIELLPFNDSPPTWDGSYPHLVISPIAESNPLNFKYSIAMLQPTVRHDSPVNELDVDLHTGRFILRQTDLFVPDVIPLALTRTYITWDYHSRAFGVGGNHPYDICPTGTRFPYTYQNLNLEDGYEVYMPRISEGTGYADAVFRHSQTSSEFYGAQDAWNGNGWTFTFRDGRRMFFPEAYFAKSFAQGAATEMRDAEGHSIHLKRDALRNLERLISPSGHTISFKYDGDRIIEADDGAVHIRQYSYDLGGHLTTISDGTRILYRLEYERLMSEAGYDPWLLTAVLDGKGYAILRNKYLWGRVSAQQLADGESFHFEYQLKGREVLQTIVTLPSGKKQLFSFHNGILIARK